MPFDTSCAWDSPLRNRTDGCWWLASLTRAAGQYATAEDEDVRALRLVRMIRRRSCPLPERPRSPISSNPSLESPTVASWTAPPDVTEVKVGEDAPSAVEEALI